MSASVGHSSYSLRLHERAIRDIESAFVRLSELTSLENAFEWRNGLKVCIAGLATNPRKYAIVRERFHMEVRQVTFARKGSWSVHRVIYTVLDEDEPAYDTNTVVILHIRHASSRPISAKGAQNLEAER